MRTYGNEGNALARFRIAVDIGRDESAFYNCVAFAKTAETVQRFCKKGKQVAIAGTFKNNDYEKDVNGTKVMMYGMELTVNRLVLLGDPQGGGNRQGGQPAQQQQGGYSQQPRQQQQPQAQQGNYGGGGFGGFGNAPQQQQQQQQPQADPFPNNNSFGGFGADDLPF